MTKKKTLLKYVPETANALGSLIKMKDTSHILKMLTDIVEKKYDFEDSNGEEEIAAVSEENGAEEVIQNGE
jgi:hypothetical protein